MEDTERLVVLLEARVNDFEKNLRKASGTAGREYDRMRRTSQSATQQMEQDMVRSTSRINQALATVSSRVGAFGAAFAPVAAGIGAAGLAVAGFAVQARATAREIATIGDEAKRAGINVKGFQELKFVADQNRVSIDALTDGIKEMNLRADEFIVTGSGSGAEAFKRLGFTATDLAKKLKDPSALFTEIIGKLEKMDKAAQIRIMDEVFGGTGGEQFVQLLEQGEAGLRRTIAEANRLGIVMDEQMIAKAAEVDRQFGALATTVETKLKGAIVNAASALADFMEGFRSFESQRDSTLNNELSEIGKRRLENEKRIGELRGGATSFNRGRSESAATLLEEENAALAEQEKQILDVLKARGAFNASSKEMEAGLRNVGQGNQTVGDSLDYVTRNGGAAAATVDQYGKSIADLRARLTDTVAGARLTVDTFGQTEGAIAAARFEADAMADALRAAAAAGKAGVDPALKTFIQEQAAEYGRLTDRISASTKAEEERQRVADKARERSSAIATFESDLAFERSILTLPEAEQQIRTTLRGLDVEFDSFEGQRLASGMRYNAALSEQQDALRNTRSIVDDLGDSFADVFAQATRDGENFFDSFLRGLSGIGNQLAAAGAKNLLGKLFNVPSAANDNGGNIGGLIGAPAASSSGYASGNFASAPMLALNDNLTKVSRSAIDVAKQFNGLNERADSRVLDSFLRTSGNWKNLSAADTAWCAAFANAAIMQTGGQGTGSNLASSFMNWGQGTNAPKVGDIVVLKPQSRGASGHVGFVAGFGDGTVQVFGGNQSNGANTRSFGLDQVRGYRTAGTAPSATQSLPDQRIFARGVSDGMKDFSRWHGTPSLQAQNAMANGSFDGFSHNGGGTGLFSQNGLGAVAGIAGLFGSGYSSGNPLMGAVSGALGGMQLGGTIASAFPALAGVAGPAGMAVGAIASPLTSRRQTGADIRRRAAAYHSKKEMTDDSRQCRAAA